MWSLPSRKILKVLCCRSRRSCSISSLGRRYSVGFWLVGRNWQGCLGGHLLSELKA